MDNVQEKYKFAFKPCKSCTNQGLPYDCKSIMQYGRYAFAKNTSKPTISGVPGKCDDNDIKASYEKTALSELDIKGINMMYKCNTAGIPISHFQYCDKNHIAVIQM